MAIELRIVRGVRSVFRESVLMCTVLTSNTGWLDGSKTRIYHGLLNWGWWVSHPAIRATSLPWVLLPLTRVSMATCPASRYPERKSYFESIWFFLLLLRNKSEAILVSGSGRIYRSGNADLCSLINLAVTERIIKYVLVNLFLSHFLFHLSNMCMFFAIQTFLTKRFQPNPFRLFQNTDYFVS